MPQWAALAQFLADLWRPARVAGASRDGSGLTSEQRGNISPACPGARAACSATRGNRPRMNVMDARRTRFFLAPPVRLRASASLHLQGKKISNLLATLTPRRRMTVDARAKQVSLLCEFPLRSSNGALNGSLTRSNQGLESRWSARPGYFSPGSQKPN